MLNAVLTTLTEQHGWSPERYLVLATTGKAATVVQGATMHSPKEGLSIPVTGAGGRAGCVPLQRQALKDFQERLGNVDLVVIDEFSMMKLAELHYCDLRLRQARPDRADQWMGGCTVVLVGDLGQLPPVCPTGFWWQRFVPGKNGRPGGLAGLSNSDARKGMLLWNLFNTALKLTECRRIQGNDASARRFYKIQMRLRDGECTAEDHKYLFENCSEQYLTREQWKERGFDGDDVVHLFSNNKDVNNYNNRRLQELGTPIIEVKATHNQKQARQHSSDGFRGLEAEAFFAVNARVMLTSNICQSLGMANGSSGVIKEIVYANGVTRATKEQPMFIVVDFGSRYYGPAFFNDADKRGWVPIAPITATKHVWDSRRQRRVDLERTMFPLKLAWAWTVHKSQGQTFIGPVLIDPGRREMTPGLLYVAISRATRIQNIGFVGERLTKQRLCENIAQQDSLQHRKMEEQRLDMLCDETQQMMNELEN